MASTPTLNRRKFLASTGLALTLPYLSTPRTRAKTLNGRIRFALIGINHDHVFRMVQAVRDGGGELAMVYAKDADPNHSAKFFRDNPGVKQAREEREVLEAPDIALVVSAAPPAERAELGIRVMRAGKDFMVDKGGFLDLESLAEVRRVQAETKRIYSISYNERLLDPPTVRAGELVRAGAIGRVTHTLGLGPHGLFGHGPREDWFWTRQGRGGILTDLATHQADQFLFFTGSTQGEVVTARTANYQTPEHAEFEDFGEVSWKGNGGTGYARVDFFRGKSLGIRLTVLGTEGSMEITKHSGQIVLADAQKTQQLKVEAGFVCPYGRQLVDDVLNRTETAMSQAHAFLASELAVRAQMIATQANTQHK